MEKDTKQNRDPIGQAEAKRRKHELDDSPTQALEEGEPSITGRTHDQKDSLSDDPKRAKPPGQVGRHGGETA